MANYCNGSVSIMGGGITVAREPLRSREILLEKFGHKTETEKRQWIFDNHISVKHPNVYVGGVNGTAYGRVAGLYNQATGGGAQGYIGFTATATGYGTVVAGSNNVAIGGYSAIVGGIVNVAFGNYSTISGGIGNTAITHSFITPEEYQLLGKVGTKRWSFSHQ